MLNTLWFNIYIKINKKLINLNYILSFVPGLTSPTGNCSAGYYCSLSSISQVPVGQSYGDICLTGHYCPEGTGTPVPCPIGTYLPDVGKSDVTQCVDCYPGKYCETTGLSNVTGDCSAGYYCFLGANTSTPTDGMNILTFNIIYSKIVLKFWHHQKRCWIYRGLNNDFKNIVKKLWNIDILWLPWSSNSPWIWQVAIFVLNRYIDKLYSLLTTTIVCVSQLSYSCFNIQVQQAMNVCV